MSWISITEARFDLGFQIRMRCHHLVQQSDVDRIDSGGYAHCVITVLVRGQVLFQEAEQFLQFTACSEGNASDMSRQFSFHVIDPIRGYV